MGYDVHITRATKSWHDNKGCEISEDEWWAIVANDSELRAATPEALYYMAGAVLWSCPSAEMTWFCWSDGNIYTKNPNSSIMAKMLCLAQKMSARVQGDDGEFYLADGRVLEEDGMTRPGTDWRTW